MMLLPVNTLIAERYTLHDLLGSGGMGAVYRAHDKVEDKTVAIKLLTLAPGEGHIRFRREFRVMQRLEHPHIIRSYDSGVYQDDPYLVMEFVAGGNLQHNMAQDTRSLQTTFPQRLEIALQVAEALAYIHGQGVIHRDLKPDNIMLAQPFSEGGASATSPHAILMDFGLVKTNRETIALTQAGAVMGTAGYMSPEQARGNEIDARSDLYALGCLIYWLLLGRAPYEGKSAAQIIIKQMREPAQPLSQYLPNIPERLDTLVMRLLEKVPSDRYSSASDVAHALREIVMTSQQRLLQASVSPEDAATVAEALVLPSVATVQLSSVDDISPAQLFNAPLIGRDALMQQLKTQLLAQQTMLEPRHKHILIEAETGMGSSRLLREFRREARSDKVHVLYLHQHRGVVSPYKIWRDGLQQLKQHYPEHFASTSADFRDVLTSLLPELGGSGMDSSLSADKAQNLLYDTMDQFMSRWAQNQPLVMIVDNLQAFDQASLGMVTYLLRGKSRENLSSLLCLQPEHLSHASRTMLAEVVLEHLPLPPLAEQDIRALIQALLGGDPVDNQLEQYLVERAAGSPFFVSEILNSLLKAKQIRRRSGAWLWDRSRASIPPSVGEIFVQRLDALPDEVQKTALAASTIGRYFSFRLLTLLLRYDEDDVLDYLDALLRVGLIHEAGEDDYRFVNVLVREVLHHRLFHRSRMRYHETIAKELSQVPETDPAHLADHYAETRKPERAIPCALQAADNAEKIYANDISEKYYRLALAHLEPSQPEWAEATLKLGKVLDRIGRWDEAKRLYHALEANEAYHTRALHALGKLHQRQGELAKSEDYLRRALGLAEAKLEIYSDLGRTLTYKADLQDARGIYMEALELAEGLEDKDGQERKRLIARAQLDLGFLEHFSSNSHEAVAWLHKAQNYVSAKTDRLLTAKINHTLGIAYQKVGQSDEAKECLEFALGLYRDIGEVEPALSIMNNLANNAFYSDDYEAAYRLYGNVVERAYQIGEKRMQALAISNQGVIDIEWGNFSQAVNLLKKAVDLFQQLGFIHYQIYTYTSIATCLIRTHDFQDVPMYIEKADALLQDSPHEEYVIDLFFTKGEFAMRLGKYKEAIAWFDKVINGVSSTIIEIVGEARIYILESMIMLGATGALPQAFEDATLFMNAYGDDILKMRLDYLRAHFNDEKVTQVQLEQKFREIKAYYYVDLFRKLPVLS